MSIALQELTQPVSGGGGGGGSGTVVGPATATDNAVARYDLATGQLLQDSLVTISDAGSISLPALQTVDGRDVSVDGAKLDNVGVLSSTTPAAVGAAAVGVGTTSARADHVHAHGNQLGGTLHADADGTNSGFLSSAGFTKLAGVATGAAALTAVAPVNVTKATAAVGVGTAAAREDHKHDITTAVAVAVGAANAEGVATSLSRSDHVHDASAKADVLYTINAQTGTTYTLVLTDALTKLVTLSNASAITLTIPLNSSVAFSVGTTITLMQLGAGQVTVVGAGGVTLNNPGLTAKARNQYSFLTLVKLATDTWAIAGDLALS